MQPTDVNDRKVLVTGGAGFIGTHTVDALIAAGADVRVLDNLDPQVHRAGTGVPDDLDPDAELIVGDVRDADVVDRALDGVDAVLHLASLTGVGQSMYDLRSYSDVNITGTATLLERILKSGIQLSRVVLSSSRATYGEGTFSCERCGNVYPEARRREDLDCRDFDVRCPSCGRTPSGIPTAEDRPLHPSSVYGWTKRCQEEQCRYAAETFGMPVTVLRYFNVYGSRQSLSNPYTGIVSIFYTRLREGLPISIYEQGVPIRDFVHVSDVVRTNLAALKTSLKPGAVLNVGTGVGSTIPDVAMALAEALEQESEIAVTDDYRVGDIHSCVADIGRHIEAFGFRPTVPLREGMAEFVSWAQRSESVDLYDRMVDEMKAFGLFGKRDGS
jgi:dTDP-L-rhamnose 4-epimerase